jgi:Raf kinase inhibitor-like YbhB/YbcL family protein
MRFAIVLFGLTLPSACSGRREEARPDSTHPQRSTTMPKTSGTQTLIELAITSSAFEDGAAIPSQFTCDGANESPALSWSGAPKDIAAYALIVEDPDAPSGMFIHWVLYDVPGTTTSLPQALPKTPSLSSLGGAKQGTNGFKKVGYDGPCPPKGAPHHYHFKLFALDKPLGIAPGASRDQIMDAMKGHELGHGEIIGTYARKG